MAKSYAGNAGYREWRGESLQRSRSRMINGKLRGQGTEVVSSSQRLPDYDDPRSVTSQVARQRVVHGLAASSVPVDHLNGLQFLKVNRTSAGQWPSGAYWGESQRMEVDLPEKFTPESSARLARTSVHEVGHHVDNMTHGGLAGNPYLSQSPRAANPHSEGVAENYADAHAPRYTRKTPDGQVVRQRPRANYDRGQSWHFDGNEEAAAHYRHVRKSGLMPTDPRPADAETPFSAWGA